MYHLWNKLLFSSLDSGFKWKNPSKSLLCDKLTADIMSHQVFFDWNILQLEFNSSILLFYV